MKIKLFTLVILFITYSCSPNKSENKEKEDKYYYDYSAETTINTDTTMMNNEKFNWELYNTRDRGLSYRKDDGDTSIYMINSLGGIGELISYSNSYYSDSKSFHISTSNIKEEGKVFTRGYWQSGIWKYYDEHGRLTHTIDYDKPFTFGIDSVFAFMEKRDMNLAIGYDRSIYDKIKRYFWEGHPYWEIQYGRDKILETITLDGKTGKVIKEEYTDNVWII